MRKGIGSHVGIVDKGLHNGAASGFGYAKASSAKFVAGRV